MPVARVVERVDRRLERAGCEVQVAVGSARVARDSARARRPGLHAPNQTWTWDITLLRGPHRGAFFRLYVILDLFSRFVVGWLLGHHENGKLAARALREACEREAVNPSGRRGCTEGTHQLATIGCRRAVSP